MYKKKYLFFLYLILVLSSCQKESKPSEQDQKIKELEEKLSQISNEKIVKDSVEKQNSQLVHAYNVKSESKYKVYCNGKFDFCISYPSRFIPQGESENGDGQSFLSPDGKAEITAFASRAFEDLNWNLKEEMKLRIQGNDITYKTIKNNWFVISGYDEEAKVFYEKTLRRNITNPGDNSTYPIYQSLRITYPKDENNKYSSYCKLISKSF